MDIYFATFNCDKPDLRKARVDFNNKFGAGSYVQYIKPYLDRGIMSIFNDEPTEHTRFYVETLSRYVNERLGEPDEEPEVDSEPGEL